MAVLRACPSALASESMGACEARLLAMTTSESLVEVSPSTVTRLKDASASSSASCCMRAGLTQASVAMKPSMVAMLGRIMPAPLLTPVMLTRLPPMSSCAPKALGRVSVVMMASLVRNQLSSRASASAASSPASMRSLGKGSMMTPVENGKICC